MADRTIARRNVGRGDPPEDGGIPSGTKGEKLHLLQITPVAYWQAPQGNGSYRDTDEPQGGMADLSGHTSNLPIHTL